MNLLALADEIASSTGATRFDRVDKELREVADFCEGAIVELARHATLDASERVTDTMLGLTFALDRITALRDALSQWRLDEPNVETSHDECVQELAQQNSHLRALVQAVYAIVEPDTNAAPHGGEG